MGVISLISVIAGLAILVYLVCKNTSLLIAAPLASLLVLIFSRMNLVEGITEVYSSSLGNFITNNMLIFMTGSIFGSIMGDTGAAQDIAHSMTGVIDKLNVKNKKFVALMVLTLVCMVLNYGGISG